MLHVLNALLISGGIALAASALLIVLYAAIEPLFRDDCYRWLYRALMRTQRVVLRWSKRIDKRLSPENSERLWRAIESIDPNCFHWLCIRVGVIDYQCLALQEGEGEGVVPVSRIVMALQHDDHDASPFTHWLFTA